MAPDLWPASFLPPQPADDDRSRHELTVRHRQHGASIDKMPLILNVRHYEEFNAERRISGSLSIATVTLKF